MEVGNLSHSSVGVLAGLSDITLKQGHGAPSVAELRIPSPLSAFGCVELLVPQQLVSFRWTRSLLKTSTPSTLSHTQLKVHEKTMYRS